MNRTLRPLAAALLFAGVGVVTPLTAQDVTPPRQVISANPFGLLLEFFNAEYERAVSPSFTAGIGGSYGTFDDDADESLGETAEEHGYFNADVFARFYPGGQSFDGWNFGAKIGLTNLPSGTYPGFGFDVNRSWLLGANNNFYVSAGFGLKRLIGDVAEDEIDIVPTFRIINVGFAF